MLLLSVQKRIFTLSSSASNNPASSVAKFASIAGRIADLVLEFGGALSGEHGDGLVRSPFQEKMYGPVLYQAFRELKRTFDPLNILNPGKVVFNFALGSKYLYDAIAKDQVGPYVTPSASPSASTGQ